LKETEKAKPLYEKIILITKQYLLCGSQKKLQALEILIYSLMFNDQQTNNQKQEMIIYNVTTKHESVHDQWMIWMQHKHIPEILDRQIYCR
jgi:hypothetical protein